METNPTAPLIVRTLHELGPRTAKQIVVHMNKHHANPRGLKYTCKDVNHCLYRLRDAVSSHIPDGTVAPVWSLLPAQKNAVPTTAPTQDVTTAALTTAATTTSDQTAAPTTAAPTTAAPTTAAPTTSDQTAAPTTAAPTTASTTTAAPTTAAPATSDHADAPDRAAQPVIYSNPKQDNAVVGRCNFPVPLLVFVDLQCDLGPDMIGLWKDAGILREPGVIVSSFGPFNQASAQEDDKLQHFICGTRRETAVSITAAVQSHLDRIENEPRSSTATFVVISKQQDVLAELMDAIWSHGHTGIAARTMNDFDRTLTAVVCLYRAPLIAHFQAHPT